MSKIHVQRLTTITQQQATLTLKQQQIEAELAKTIVVLLKEAHAFTIDFDVLIGGILDAIQKAKSNDRHTEVWRAEGVRFRKRKQRKKRGHTETPDANTSC